MGDVIRDIYEHDTCLIFGFEPDESGKLADLDHMTHTLRISLDEAGIDVFGDLSHKFTGGGEGVTACNIIGASCADIHTWPENGILILRCFACGDKEHQVKAFISSMVTRLHPTIAYSISDRLIPSKMPKNIPATWTLLHERSNAHRH